MRTSLLCRGPAGPLRGPAGQLLLGRAGSSCLLWEGGTVFQLRFTTLVEAPLTVAFDVARTLGRPWGSPLEEVVSVRPERDVYAVGRGSGWVTHSRRFT